MSEQQEETRSSREMLNFIILIVVLLGAVAIVALTRPLIFGKIVPAVMGEGIEQPIADPVNTPAEEATTEEQPADTAYPGEEEAMEEETTTDGEPADADADDANDSDDGEDADEAGDSDDADNEEEEVGETADSDTASEPATDETEIPATDPVAETDTTEPAAGEESEAVTHTIKQGETLQTIAAQYGITLPELIAANQLANPDYIRVGDKLTIPQAQE